MEGDEINELPGIVKRSQLYKVWTRILIYVELSPPTAE